MMTGLATTLSIADELEFPLSIRTLADFRAWARSDDFPERGRIDYIEERIEVDMAPEDAWFHSVPKNELITVLYSAMKRRRLGAVFSDRMRYSSADGGLSVEPDLLLILHSSRLSGKSVLVPKSGRQRDRCIEIQGAADLVVEIVSDSSVHKDLKRLPPAYFAAGVEEFWLVDVRPGKFLFQIHHRGDTDWQPATARADGGQHSQILDRWYRLEQHAEPTGAWTYDLLEAE